MGAAGAGLEGWDTLRRALGEPAPTLVEERLRVSTPGIPRDTADTALLEALGCRSALLAPIVVQGRPVGIITLGTTTPRRYDEGHCALMAEIARRAATAVENARLYADERRARAEAEAAIRVRDELTALIAHDLRNPLTVVLGQSELLLRQLQLPELDRGRLSRSVDSVRGAAAQMRLLLDDLLDIAHLRAGQPLHLEPAPTDLVALARQAATVQQAANPRHELRVDAPLPALWCVCDARRLERVLANLLGNAIKFSPAGGLVTLAVGRIVEADSAWATLSVADQGVGIPPDDLAAIFAPYHRARNVIGAIRGTGLGLASVYAIITQHEGTVGATSTAGVGSTFTVRLPLEQEHEAPDGGAPGRGGAVVRTSVPL